MRIEKRLRADAKSFADEVKDFDDQELLDEILVRLGIQPGLTNPSASGCIQRPEAGGPFRGSANLIHADRVVKMKGMQINTPTYGGTSITGR